MFPMEFKDAALPQRFRPIDCLVRHRLLKLADDEFRFDLLGQTSATTSRKVGRIELSCAVGSEIGRKHGPDRIDPEQQDQGREIQHAEVGHDLANS